MVQPARKTWWEQGSERRPADPGPLPAQAVRQLVSPALDRLTAAGTITVEQAAAVRREIDVALGDPALPARTAEAPEAPDAAGTALSTTAPEAPGGPDGPGGRGGPDTPGRPGSPAPAVRTGPARHGIAWAPILAEVGGYVGGAFVIGAAAVLVSDNWSRLSVPARLAVLAIPALLLLVAAAAVARSTPGGWHPGAAPAPRRRMIATFTTVAAALLGLGAGVLVEAGPAREEVVVLSGFWTALVVAGIGYAVCRGTLLHLACGAAVVGAVLSAQSAVGEWDEQRTGWVLAVIGVAWGLATGAGVLAEREVGYGWAAILAFVGSEVLTASDAEVAGYLALGVLAAAGLAGFVVRRSTTLLVTGVLTLAVVVPQVVIDATDGALGAAGALLVVGLSLVGASTLGLRLRRTDLH